MATHKSAALAATDEVRPAIRDIKPDDLIDALKKGFDDFKAMPSHVFILAIIYPIAGLVLARLSFGYDILPILFPIISGFALVGPLAAVGLYELSRRRELGRKVHWKHALEILKSPSIDSILALGFMQLVIYL
ncbi:MAG: DUF2189 domain-containing protein, partial [Methyloligellaceae bacterium]